MNFFYSIHSLPEFKKIRRRSNSAPLLDRRLQQSRCAAGVFGIAQFESFLLLRWIVWVRFEFGRSRVFGSAGKMSERSADFAERMEFPQPRGSDVDGGGDVLAPVGSFEFVRYDWI